MLGVTLFIVVYEVLPWVLRKAKQRKDGAELRKRKEAFLKNIHQMDFTCSICLHDGNRGLKTDCGHMYHQECMSEWVELSPTCPICRKLL
mmetsp:Transcript_17891/g.71759  ORF Transcript_17891/g.71759 Transcript_17891/m.71759 type:complete len:90 (+) Transcript_17891:179-448(+)